MKVSVIIPAYNGSRTIKETISSILAQTYTDLELIVVDDGSTDESAEIIKSIKDPRLKYYHQENTGSPAGPRNLGIKKASGAMIALCDQDDIWYPEKIAKQLEVYQASGHKDEVGIAISSVDLIDSSGVSKSWNQLEFEGYLAPRSAFEGLLESNYITACSALIPRKVIDDIGGFDANLRGVDDFDLWLRITQKYGVLVLKEPLCAWRLSGENLSQKKSALYAEDEKVFAKLEKIETSAPVRRGHAKNLTRLLVASILEQEKTIFSSHYSDSKDYPISIGARILFFLYNLNESLGYFSAIILKKVGLIKL